MKENFNRSLKLILRHEGGYTDHPKDPGGATNKGITIGTLRRWRKRKVSKRDVRNLKMKEITKIYKAFYWDKVKCDQVKNAVDYCLFDFCVNAGPRRSVITIQRAVGVRDDGRIGPITLAAIKKMPSKRIILRFANRRLWFYKSLRTFKYFGRGWTRRTNECKRDALRML